MVYVHEGEGGGGVRGRCVVYCGMCVCKRCVGVCMCTKYILIGTTSVET